MARFLLAALLFCLAAAASGQEAPAAATGQAERDRDFITAFLEDNLSGAGRQVRIDGFAGALSSRATFAKMTIADADGVWITLTDGAIGWNRAALLAGRVEVSELSAASIDLVRLPAGEGAKAEAKGFALPDLPVSVEIGRIGTERLSIGADVFGIPAVVRLDGRLTLAGGAGTAKLDVERIDGRTGTIALDAAYANESAVLSLDLLFREGPGGIAAQLIGLPGAPATELALHGQGRLDDLRLDLALSTDGAPRFAGEVRIGPDAGTAAEPGDIPFAADLSGDLSPLFAPEYRRFFGDRMVVQAVGLRRAAGGFALSRLALDTAALDVTGRLAVGADGMPEAAALTVLIRQPDGTETLLPLAGEKTWFGAADLRLRYDRSRGDGWSLEGELSGLRRAGLRIAALTAKGSGRIASALVGGAPEARFGGTVRFAAMGIAAEDPALARALGEAISGRAVFHWRAGEKLRLPVLEIDGARYHAKAGLSVSLDDSGPVVAGRVAARLAALADFAPLAGRPLAGAAELTAEGEAGLLSGIFDITATVAASGLQTGIAELDGLLAGRSDLQIDAARDTGGIALRRLDLAAGGLSATLSGRIASAATDLAGETALSDLSALGPRYRGAASARFTLTADARTRRVTLAARGRDLGIGQAEADRLLAGETVVELAAEETGGRIWVESLNLDNPQLRLAARASEGAAAPRLDVTARLADVALIVPEFPGPLELSGTLARGESGFDADLAAQGPGGMAFTVAGRIDDALADLDLAIRGSALAALANPFIAPRNVSGLVAFDLRLAGRPAPDALSGRVTLNNGRAVAPTFGINLEDLSATLDLADARASLNASARVARGGALRLSGPISLAAPFVADLSLTLDRARLQQSALYETVLSGEIGVSGPLRGGGLISGAITLETTEISIQAPSLGPVAAIDGLTHLDEPAAVHRTRVYAGLARDEAESAGTGSVFDLDLRISAPRRLFVRGRGLDAELAGALRVSGTTQQVIPEGRFELVRGRLDILGKRFTLDEGQVQLRGALIPYIRFAASAESEGITATVSIEGDADAPEVSFRSVPELPEEEVIAQLLFGRSLTRLSPFQAAQLASAVATLTGRGGEGLVSRIRGSLGLDDLDLTSDEQGTTAVRAGKYLSERLYSDVTVGSDGKSRINLNFDVNRSLTLRGSVDSEGSTGVGVFWERDY